MTSTLLKAKHLHPRIGEIFDGKWGPRDAADIKANIEAYDNNGAWNVSPIWRDTVTSDDDTTPLLSDVDGNFSSVGNMSLKSEVSKPKSNTNFPVYFSYKLAKSNSV